MLRNSIYRFSIPYNRYLGDANQWRFVVEYPFALYYHRLIAAEYPERSGIGAASVVTFTAWDSRLSIALRRKNRHWPLRSFMPSTVGRH